MPSIIQLDLNPIPAGDRLTPGFFDYGDELMRTVAEYVKDDSDPEATLGEFQDYLLSKNPCVECFQEGDNRGICFREGFQGHYFRDAHAAFVRLAGKLARDTTLGGFIRDEPSGDLFAMREAYNDRYGWYVYYETMTMTLDKFMRQYAGPDQRYYFGGVVYYHT